MHPHQNLRILGATLGILVAGIHMFHPQGGLPRLIKIIRRSAFIDPRPPVFVLSAIAIIVGIILVTYGKYVKYVYIGGMLLMVSYLLGFVLWHTALDHGAFWPYRGSYGHTTGVIEFVQVHLINEPDQLLSKVLELLLLVVLVMLYKIDVTADKKESSL